ncbi:SDR family oxidoreductase [Kineococcus sp. SYSU DK006]|uniref:SDR family oxidoreductase n=1 Tax=Kineococcus sp. SYSU DK006 TaxID=3383127 RepID=UPI003D7D4459
MQSTGRTAVAGGTGTAGRHVVDLLRERGHDVVVLARATGVDLLTGVGLDAALAGVGTVVDVTSTTATSSAGSVRFFRPATEHLLAAAARAGVRHHLVLSVVGTDRAPFGHYAGKLVQEALVAQGPVPWTVLRATQFHEFAAQFLERSAVGPLAVVPRARCEPVAAREVAERIASLVAAGPAGRVADLAGPREERLADLARAWAAAAGRRGAVLEVPLPGAFGAAARDGSLLGGPGADRGRLTFERWLAQRGRAPAASAG